MAKGILILEKWLHEDRKAPFREHEALAATAQKTNLSTAKGKQLERAALAQMLTDGFLTFAAGLYTKV